MKARILRREDNVNESVLDFPKEDLDRTVWTKNDDGTYSLSEEAQVKVWNVVAYVLDEIGLDSRSVNVNITGSITSNSYTDDSDIDVHFSSSEVKKADAEEMVETVREAFDKYKEVSGDDWWWHIGTHPIETYFQANPFQDLMSVGCYSFTQGRWLVGPEFEDTSFNPFEEYYDKDMRHVNKLIGDMRSLILETYEKALVVQKLSGKERDSLMKSIELSLERSAALFTNVRKTRKHMSDPKSEEEAKKFRNDKRWKIADSAFKLLDKFGYLAILREYASQHENGVVDADKLIQTVRQNLGPENKKLHEIDGAEHGGPMKRCLFKMWVDSDQEPPSGYAWFRTVNDAISFIEDNGLASVAVLDLGHDAGRFQCHGGDYIKILDYLDAVGAEDVKIRIHSENPAGAQDMRDIIVKNGWTETDEVLGQTGIPENTGEQLDEGPSKMLSIAAVAGMLSIPGILPAQTLVKCIKNLPRSELRASSKPFQDMIKEIGSNEMIGDFSEKNSINILAWTLWCEAGGESLDGKKAVASTILNRAGGIPEYLVPEALRKSQFSEWNPGNQWGLVAPKTDSDWTYSIPKNATTNQHSIQSWNDCVELAAELAAGNFKSTIGKNNMIANKRIDSEKSWNAWGKDCKLVIGNQSFGYDKSQDGYIKYADRSSASKPRVHIVKKGDTLSKIARDYGIALEDLMLKNKIRNPNQIRIGQKLKL